jgi:hypothetical protein
MSEPSLIDKVADLLGNSSTARKDAFKRSIKAPKAGDDEVKVLNNYFRVELSKVEASTTDERGCLIDNIPPAKWLQYFEVHVLPTLVRFDLPKD